MPRIGSHVAWPDSTACEMSRTWTHIPAAEYRRGTEDSDAADAEAAEDRCAAARSLSSYLLSASSCLRRSFIALGRTDGIPALGPVSPAQQITANVLQNAVSWLLLWLFSPRKSLHNCWTSATHCKGKVWTLAISPLTWVDSWPPALYNLGSGSWLAWANGAAAHYVAIHCPR